MEGGMTKENEDESLGFKWLKKRGVGGLNKKIQFYESFVYDEVEYTLYDCVYMYKEGYPMPYIGKVIKIWELEDKSKKVKVHWFFYVWEILNYLGDKRAQDKEIFLASGEGFGVANINPLEAITGKCNVVCISKDSRNAQPSDEDLETADYIFYRTFDVQSCTILDKMDEKVGELKIQYIFNRNKHENPSSSIRKLTSERKNTKNATESDDTVQPSSQNPSDISITLKTDEKNQLVARKESLAGVEPASEAGVKQASGTVKGTREEAAASADDGKTTWKGDSNHDEMKVRRGPAIQVKDKEKARSAKDSNNLNDRPNTKSICDNSIKLFHDKDLREKLPVHENGVKPTIIQVNVKERATSAQEIDSLKDQPGTKARGDNDIKLRVDKDLKEKLRVHENSANAPTIQAKVKERATVASNTDNMNAQPSNLKDQPGKNAMGDYDIIPREDKDLKEKIPVRENGVKPGVTTSRLEEILNDPHGKSSPRTGKRMRFAIDDDPEGWPSKKAKVDDSLKLSKVNRNKVQNSSTNNNGSDAKDPKPNDILSEEHKKSRLVLDSMGTKKGSNKEQPDGKVRKLSSEKLPKVSAIELAEKNTKTAYQEFEITRKPDDDKSRWFRELPWEERLQTAYEQGTLVFLQNLDPEYTSKEVEGIIWHAFNESCTAKVVQRTAISSPFSGQALIIFKGRGATERVVMKLGTGILMLPNGRPLVGSRGPPCNSSGKQFTFFGHLVIDKIKNQRQWEMNDAVSTSHCSQPNTIEYEMAMEWCLLRTRSEICWSKLYKDQREQLQKLENDLKKK